MVCAWQWQVREREAEIDGIIGPIEEMYALLARYEVPALPKFSLEPPHMYSMLSTYAFYSTLRRRHARMWRPQLGWARLKLCLNWEVIRLGWPVCIALYSEWWTVCIVPT